MNKILISAAVLAAVVAPQTVLAEEANDGFAAADASTRFDLVDPRSGRIVAVLVPVAGSPGTLRVIGSVRAAADLARPDFRPEALGPNQMIEVRQHQLEEQFHVDRTS